MVNILVLGGTGPTGLALIEEAIARGHTVVIFARSPQKLPAQIIQHSAVIVIKGSLEEENDISKAFEIKLSNPIPGSDYRITENEDQNPKFLQIDAVVSALGPPVLGIHPSGHPIAKGYENVIRVAKRHRVKRFIILGTASIPDENDKFDVRFKALVLGVKRFAPHAYEEIVEIGKVFEQADQIDWTIARIPVLVEHKADQYGAGYIGDGTTTLFLTRPLFAKFVFDEVKASAWVHKRPFVSWIH